MKSYSSASTPTTATATARKNVSPTHSALNKLLQYLSIVENQSNLLQILKMFQDKEVMCSQASYITLHYSAEQFSHYFMKSKKNRFLHNQKACCAQMNCMSEQETSVYLG
ncbi:hypothetical protein T11_10275 [Trichinella zimbabwensis]|uniref:Uncharacterized protein n=1 Tax=Trichinella zimbabwensis TaxID=268475 RepID=A0A0V1HXY0_9BILA|nr:hypothetical protein T11_10275 [Trichinella zimbabwensis]